MRILHYSLGFPPYRTGGLTKFCVDLMEEQVKEGHEVSLLWPGEMQIFGKETKIRKHDQINGIGNYEVINPTPIPFDEGIKDFFAFKNPGNAEVYESFLKNVNPDVIHIHTLMGLHKCLLDVANRNEIRLVFTTHDFFPICPKVTMFRHGKICESFESCEECGTCNSTALSLRKIRILQSPLYRNFKNTAIVKKLRKQHRDVYLGDDSDRNENGVVGTPLNYKDLRAHYQEMLSMMDVIHYNSSVTKSVYEQVFNMKNSVLIPITHSNVVDNKKRKTFNGNQIRIRYLGPQGRNKGFYLLKAALDKLWKESHNFCLDIHFIPVESSPYMRTHDRYSYSELETIFNETDVLIAPSICYETFGYTVLEALSFGVPVIISGTVGAKDILANGAGIVINDIDMDGIYSTLRTVNADKLNAMNEVIVSCQHIQTIKEMSDEIEQKVYHS